MTVLSAECRVLGNGTQHPAPSTQHLTHGAIDLSDNHVPYRVEKPWGYELIWARTDRYAGKVLHVNAGHVLSRQYHNVKDETMHVLRGELIIRLGTGSEATERRLLPGESVRIAPKTIHQIEAIEDSDVLEASTPELDDLVRISDRYGRA